MPYADTQELRAMLDVKDDLDDTLLELAVESASAWIDNECERTFTLDDLVASAADPAKARTYFPGAWEDLNIDDFDPATTIIVKTDTAGDQSFATTLTLNTDYFPLPLNASAQARPYHALRRIGNCWPQPCRGLPTVRVTARWGWPAVPDAVKQACLIRAQDIFKNKDTPFGVAGFGDFGAVRVRANAEVDALLFPYRRRTLVA